MEDILNQLASALDRRDEVPNQALATKIVKTNDTSAIKILVENLGNRSKAIQNDCIKVLYEVGAQNPTLIKAYLPQFVAALQSKNNRLQWGAMTALGTIVSENPSSIFETLPLILGAADKGSVITKDHAVNILIALSGRTEYEKTTFPLLIEQLLQCPTNQLPMYAERAIPVVNKDNKETFINALSSRLNDFDKATKRSRVEKVIKKVNQ